MPVNLEMVCKLHYAFNIAKFKSLSLGNVAGGVNTASRRKDVKRDYGYTPFYEEAEGEI